MLEVIKLSHAVAGNTRGRPCGYTALGLGSLIALVYEPRREPRRVSPHTATNKARFGPIALRLFAQSQKYSSIRPIDPPELDTGA
jgi:hypothetical protein